MLNEEIRDLYINKKLSIRQIGEKLNINMWAVRSRMRHHNIPRRSTSEANVITFSRKPLSYNKKLKLTQKEKELHQAALMLYWAEGSKRTRHSIDLANCDEKILKIFLKDLYCYSNQDVKSLIEHWSKNLNIPKSQFTKPYVRSDFDPNKTDRMPFGMIHLRYADKKLLEQIKAEIDIIQRSLIS
jgi:hypothetical protein